MRIAPTSTCGTKILPKERVFHTVCAGHSRFRQDRITGFSGVERRHDTLTNLSPVAAFQHESASNRAWHAQALEFFRAANATLDDWH